MPNGGSDNCGTCWFNRKNRGETGYAALKAHMYEAGPAICEIRDGLRIHSPLYTYCANHPKHNPARIDVPLGPVFQHEDREIWKGSPDTPKVREALLRALADAVATPRAEYPGGASLAEVVMWQLGQFREARALPLLDRIAATSYDNSFGLFGAHLGRLPRAAQMAIDKIRGAAKNT